MLHMLCAPYFPLRINRGSCHQVFGGIAAANALSDVCARDGLLTIPTVTCFQDRPAPKPHPKTGLNDLKVKRARPRGDFQ